MTELENMLSGRLYLAEDESLTAARLRAQTLCRRFNDTYPGQLEARLEGDTAYQAATPFLLPNRRSIRACRETI